jgi:hypothetical protein
MKMLIDEKSTTEGRNVSRLPSFDAEWTRIINGNLFKYLQTIPYVSIHFYLQVA